MPEMRYLSVGGLPVLSVEGTRGLTWKLYADDILFRSGTGDDSFRIDSLSPGPHNMKLDILGSPLTRLSIILNPTAPPQPKPPEVPPPPKQATPTPGGYEKVEDKGTVCEILRKDFGARYFYFLRNKVTGQLSSGWENPAELWQAKGDQMGCYAQAPQTLPDWQKSISDRIKNGFDQLSEYVSGMGKRVDQIQSGLDGIWDKLEAWLVERLVALMLRALDREEE